jgi:redox-sensitive bicupin YhaK (pirin superfamily)
MSFFPGNDPTSGDPFSCEALELLLVPRSVDLDDFAVRRALPHTKRRTVGPFVFFDHFGRRNSAPAAASTCARIRISACRR